MKTLLISISFLFIVISCAKNKEPKPSVDKPTIILVSMSTPIISDKICGYVQNNVIEIAKNKELVIKLNFKSKESLSEYKIDIHDNFDCHSHGRVESTKWRISKIVNVNGTDIHIEEKLTPPEDAITGNYHLKFKLIDNQGNEADFVEYNVILKD